MAELPVVRMASPFDEDEIVAMCQRLHAENGLFTLNLEKVRECLRHCWERKGTVVGVIGRPGAIEASTCLVLSDFYYTKDWHLAEMWNFVDEEHRRSRNAEALVEFGKDCARKMNMPLFTGIITNKQMAGKVRLYRKLLGYPTGAFFIYNTHWQSEPMADYSELRNKLKEKAILCAEGKLKGAQHQAALASLLKEACEAIDAADNLWGAKSPQKSREAGNGVSGGTN